MNAQERKGERVLRRLSARATGGNGRPSSAADRTHMGHMMATRRRAVEIAAPFNARFKTRLERAVTQAIMNPSRALPTLRRAVIAATRELRRLGYDDEQIHTLFSRLVEDVARERALDATSIVSGRPRWQELASKVIAWTDSTAIETDV